MFFSQVRVFAERPAIYSVPLNRWWTYAQLHTEVEDVFQASLRVPHKALVFCFAANDAGSVLLYLAALQANHAVALLDRNLSESARNALIDRYEPDFIFDDSARTYEARVATVAYQVCDTRYGARVWRREQPEDTGIFHDLALLLTTSGSTGSPKFVRLSRRNVLSNAVAIRDALAIHTNERAITSLPIHYTYGLSVVHSHLVAGASLVLTGESVITPAFWDTFRATNCTSFAGVPYTYQMLERIGFHKFDLPSLRTMTQAGGKLSDEVIVRFHENLSRKDREFVVMYGQTEATARIACLPSRLLPAKVGSVGFAVPGGHLHIEGESTEAAGADGVGEVIYSGPNVMLGYATSREDLAQGDLQGGVLRTGDLGYLDEDGCLVLTGRSKRIAKLFGLRLNLDEVEEMVKPYGPTAVVGKEDRLLVLCAHGDDVLFGRYREELAKKLRVHHKALEFRRVDALPLTSSGKVDYASLRGL